ncbi:hypothetical protein AAF712_014480 [Marasmius tenuissimus]|uniref:Uncharacterized protein n=1 Tax=Marasmius tenuissimus TaxID=585030 RepID=A0ABR2ZD33_9AGAR
MEEWELVEALMHTLHILKPVTLYLSSEDPTVTDIIPAIDKIDQFFTTSAFETVTGPKDTEVVDVGYALKVSLMCAKQTLNKYYALTDASSVSRIATNLKWEPEWISKAHQITQEAYQNHYHNCLDLLKAYSKQDRTVATADTKLQTEGVITCPSQLPPLTLSAQSTRALMCVGNWSLKGLIHEDDLLGIAEDGQEWVPDEEKGLGHAEPDDDEMFKEHKEDDNSEEEDVNDEEETDEDESEASMEVMEFSREEDSD